MYFNWFWIDYGCVTIQLQEDFEIPKTILKFWTSENAEKNSPSGNASDLWQRSYL